MTQHPKSDYSVIPEIFAANFVSFFSMVLSINVLLLSLRIRSWHNAERHTLSSNFAITHRYLLCNVTLRTIIAKFTEKGVSWAQWNGYVNILTCVDCHWIVNTAQNCYWLLGWKHREHLRTLNASPTTDSMHASVACAVFSQFCTSLPITHNSRPTFAYQSYGAQLTALLPVNLEIIVLSITSRKK